MVYITGDTHGHFEKIHSFCRRLGTTKEDTMIILGDAGFNFFANRTDRNKKREQNNTPIKFFCIHGNHEIRPQNLDTYKIKEYWGGKVMYEPQFPDIMFAIDGEVYNIPTSMGFKNALVVGGAYSVDKYYRIFKYICQKPDIFSEDIVERAATYVHGQGTPETAKELEALYDKFNLGNKCFWWKDEQPSPETKSRVEDKLNEINWSIDFMFTHTCPLQYEPVEAFLPGIDQSKVDKTTEEWLQKIEGKLTYNKWYCGHYHVDKKIDKIRLMFENIEIL